MMEGAVLNKSLCGHCFLLSASFTLASQPDLVYKKITMVNEILVGELIIIAHHDYSMYPMTI